MRAQEPNESGYALRLWHWPRPGRRLPPQPDLVATERSAPHTRYSWCGVRNEEVSALSTDANRAAQNVDVDGGHVGGDGGGVYCETAGSGQPGGGRG